MRSRACAQLYVLHVEAPPQKKNLVPATLRPEQLKSGVTDRNIKLQQNVTFFSREREPGSKAGQKVSDTVHGIRITRSRPLESRLTPRSSAVPFRAAAAAAADHDDDGDDGS